MIYPISTNQMLISALNAGNPDPNPVDSDPVIASFEQAIDQIVKTQTSNYQAIQQAAIQKAEKQEELQKQIAFLSGAVEQAEAALSGAQGASNSPPPSQSPNGNVSYSEQQVNYWKTKLVQAEIPDGDFSAE